MEYKKKLIEVALPLEKINDACVREKSIRHGHPSTLHLWWARRPLAAARAVIWASLVDDPSSHPDLFPTEELQKKERERLFDILSRLVIWENSNNPEVLSEAKLEIMRSTGGNPPALLDPFAGGGAIPLEAQRLGLEAHAHDLNPVAVMINKAMIDIPVRFANQAPVNPEVNATFSGNSWTGASGLAEDVRYYGEWMRKEAFKRIGYLYPKVKSPNSKKEDTVIAWLWTRTVKCPNPACGCEMPLVTSFEISKKKGKEAYVVPVLDYENKKISYQVKTDGGNAPATGKTSRGAHFTCIMCGQAAEENYIKQEGSAHRMGAQMMAIVAEGDNGRKYYSPSQEQINAANVSMPDDYPTGEIGGDKRALWTPLYGLTEFHQLFTSRQMLALTTFSDLVHDAQIQAEKDAIESGKFNDHIGLEDGGSGARAYGEAIGVYLAFIVDQMTNHSSSVCGWNSVNTQMRCVFARQGIPMAWDFAECNIFSNSTGSFNNLFERMLKAFAYLGQGEIGVSRQFDAQSDVGLRNIMISTDPPYYDNIGYADLSDYFYVWLRKSLGKTETRLFRTMLVPKSEELVAIPYRFGGDTSKAKQFFEDGMYSTCCQLYKYSTDEVPVTIYYAFKQNENSNSESTNNLSSGWETMLSAIIRAGFCITGTWPMRTEKEGRSVSNGTNALASSIVIVCRKRKENASSVTRREFINALHREMKPALEALQSANIAPVDLAQSAIGPGIGVFSRYKSVIEADGSAMSVRAALQIINQELDSFYNEQEGELDAKSRFCVDIFNQYAFNTLKFGDADILARTKNTAVQALVDEGVMEASKGTVRLKTREEIPEKIDTNEDCCWKITQQMARAFERGGVKECAAAVVNLKGYIAENAKALAYRLYTICERKNWAAEGYAYNNLIVAWPDIQSEAAKIQADTPVQMTMFDQ